MRMRAHIQCQEEMGENQRITFSSALQSISSGSLQKWSNNFQQQCILPLVYSYCPVVCLFVCLKNKQQSSRAEKFRNKKQLSRSLSMPGIKIHRLVGIVNNGSYTTDSQFTIYDSFCVSKRIWKQQVCLPMFYRKFTLYGFEDDRE